MTIFVWRVARGLQRREHAERRLGPGDVDAVEVGVLREQRLGDLLAPRRIGHALLGDDLHVRIVGLDRRLEGTVALVGHVEIGVVVDVADLALAAERRGHRVRRLLAHLEEVVRDHRRIVAAVFEARRRVVDEGELHPGLERRPVDRGGARRVDGQREDDRGVPGQHRLDIRLLARGVEAGVGLRDDLDAEIGELGPRAAIDRAGVFAHLVPDQGGGVVALLDLGHLVRRQHHLGGGRRGLAVRPGGDALDGKGRRRERGGSRSAATVHRMVPSYCAASRTDCGASRWSDCCQPSATFSFVTVSAGATINGGLASPRSAFMPVAAMVRPSS